MSNIPSQNKKQPTSTLSSIVSNLVRAAIGGNHHDVPDHDLDKYVADMIMKSAEATEQKYRTTGVDAYTNNNNNNNDKVRLASGAVIDRSDSNGLKTNKRFLSSIIKSTDDHNQALIRAEEKKATEMAKELIADLDRRAAKRERSSIEGRETGNRGRSSFGRVRMDEIESRPRRSRSPPTPKRESHSRSSSRSLSPIHKSEVRVRGRGSTKYDSARSTSPYPPESTSLNLGTKMDKYFQEGYDPILDTPSRDEVVAIIKKHKKKKKKSSKDSKSKDGDDYDKRRHKKSRSDRSSESSSRKSRRRDEEDSEESDDLKQSRHRRRSGRHDSKSRRRHHDEGNTSNNEGKSSDRHRSRSRSPKDHEHNYSKKHSRSSRNRSRDHGHKRTRNEASSESNSSNNESGEESEDDRRSKKKRLEVKHSAAPSPSSKPDSTKPAAREWDLHKINKSVIQAQLFDLNKRKNP
ncbi:hypothetical protein BX616_002036 [Lobosporangium transversale]|nr:hypothetical protein BX616_002036 [Lobosporangium transversale]